MSQRHPLQASLECALALCGLCPEVRSLEVDLGVIRHRWGADDLPEGLPWVSSVTRSGDAIGVPVLDGSGRLMGSLWANAGAPVEVLERTARVVAGLGATPENDLEQLVASFPSATMALIGERVVLNRAAIELTGFQPHEVPTLDRWFSAVYGAEAALIRGYYELDRGAGFPEPRVVSLKRAGHERVVEFHGATTRGGELWFLTDITARVSSEERFRVLFEQSSTPHLLIAQSRIVDCNEAAVKMLEYRDKSELIGRQPSSLSPPLQPDGRPSLEGGCTTEEVTRALGRLRFDWVHLTATGREIPVEVTLTVQKTDGSLLAEWHDLTERVRYEEGLRAARDSALQYARAKSDFLAVMSHEIRTPMNGVIGMTRLLRDTALTPQQRDYVGSLEACSEGLLALVNDVLDFSRLEAGKVTLETIPVCLRDLVDEAMAVVAESAERRGLELAVLMEAGVPERVASDPTRLRQVLLNLLSNAVKFTHQGSIEVGLRVVGAAEPGRAEIELSVTDSGVGIAPSALPRLFTAFTQEDASTTRRFGGSGLGLAICKRLVELMNGTIEVKQRSPLGAVGEGPSGTTFVVRLPFAVVSQATAPQLVGYQALLVGAPTAAQRSLEQIFAAAGASVVRTDDEVGAVTLASEADVVIVDDERLGAAGRLLAARLVGPGRRVGLATSALLPHTEFPPGCFRVTRPLRRQAVLDAVKGAMGRTTASPPPLATPFRGVRALVAEDNPINQRVVSGLLTRLGCEVHLAENGAKALEALEAKTFDLVFMDCQMPVLDGFEATRRLRERFGGTLPVVALTASTMEGDRERCLAAGMNDFLAKPVRPDDLARVLERYASQPLDVAS